MPKVIAQQKAEEKRKKSSSASSNSEFDRVYSAAHQAYQQERQQAVQTVKAQQRSLGSGNATPVSLQEYMDKLTNLRTYGYDISGAAAGARDAMDYLERAQNPTRYASQSDLRRTISGKRAELAAIRNRTKGLHGAAASRARDQYGQRIHGLKSDITDLTNALEFNAYENQLSRLTTSERKMLDEYGREHRAAADSGIAARLGQLGSGFNPTAVAQANAMESESLERENQLRKMLRRKGYTVDQIDALLRYSQKSYNAELNKQIQQSVRDESALGKAAASLVSVPLNLAGGLAGYADLAAQRLTAKTDPFTGERQSLDYNSRGQMLGNAASGIRGAVSENMSGLGNFLYNTGMSIADFAAAGMTGRGITEALLAGSAAQQAAQQAHQRGATDDQALAMGFGAGVFEALFEHLSLAKLRGLSQITDRVAGGLARVTAGDVAKAVGVQSLTEGSEELFTSIANTAFDAMVMRDKSELNQSIQSYMAQGMSEERATREAWKEWAVGLAEDFAGGALSGGLLGGIFGGNAIVAQNAADRSLGRTITEAEYTQRLMEANVIQQNQRAGEIAAQLQKAKSGSRRADLLTGRLYNAVNEGETQTAMANRLVALGVDAEAAQTIASGIRNEMLGEETRAERAAMEQYQTQTNRVKTEYMDAMMGNVQSTNTWARELDNQQAERRAEIFDSLQGRGETAVEQTANIEEGAQNDGQGVLLRGSERNDGQSAGGEVRGMEEGPGRDSGREAWYQPADRELSESAVPEQGQVTSSQIHPDGVDSDRIYQPTVKTKAMKRAERWAKQHGKKCVFFAGDMLTVKHTMPDGSTENVRCRGMIDGDTIYLRADDAQFTSEQIAKHETTHDLLDTGRISRGAVRAAMNARYSPEEIDSIISKYASAFDGMTGEEAWDEIICDAMGGMNIFARSDSQGKGALFRDILNSVYEESNRDYEARKGQRETETEEREEGPKFSRDTERQRDEAERDIVETLGSDADVETNDDGQLVIAKSADKHTIAFSRVTLENGGREKLRKALEENGHSKEEIRDVLKRIDDAIDFIADLGVEYEGKGYENLQRNFYADIITDVRTHKQVLSTLVRNGDYPVNLDLALVCKKRVAYMRMIARLVNDGVLDQVTFGGDAIAKVNDILREKGFETACLGCFVESRRLQIQSWAETIVNEWNRQVDQRRKNAPDFGFAAGKTAKLSADELAAIEREYAGAKLNEKGNKKLKQADVENKMGQLLDTTPSLLQHLRVEDLLTPQGITALRQRDGSLFSLVQQRYGAASPKIVQDFNPYNGEIADLSFKFIKDRNGEGIKGSKKYIDQAKKKLGGTPKKKAGETNAEFAERKKEFNRQAENMAMRQYLYDIGGARMQSFSDFMIENVFDYIQMFADLAAKRLPMHGYSKEIVALRLFGMTGAKWNGSLIAHTSRSMGRELAGLMPVNEASNGRGVVVTDPLTMEQYAVCFDDYQRHKATGSFIQSIGMKDIFALQLDPRYSKNVGSITIGVSDAQIRAMLNHPLFSMVIPYHSSGMLPEYAARVGVDMYNDYTDYQNTRPGTAYDKDGNEVESLRAGDKVLHADTHFDFNEAVQRLGDAKLAAKEYLDWCEEKHPVYNGKTLIGYETFLPKFSDSPEHYDFTQEENYYKLLEDFTSYDAITGESAVQGDVKMTFPEENSLSDEEIEAYKDRLRETGIYTEKEIDRYTERAQMSFKDIVRESVEERYQYQKATEPTWEETVQAVKDALLGDESARSTPEERQQKRDEKKEKKKAKKEQHFSREMDSFSSKDEIDAEISKLMDQIRDIQNARWNAEENAKKDPRVIAAQQKAWAAEDEKGRAGSLRERVEYKQTLRKVKEELGEAIPEGDLNELSQRVNELKELREQFLKVTPITDRDYDKLAEHFGTTDDYEIAGFILKDGRMLDFSGKKQYGTNYSGGREVYHNEVGDVLNLPTDTSPRIDMVSNGNIRIVPEINGINLSALPTAEQENALRGFIEYHGGSVHVDIDNAAGRTVETFGYGRGTSASKILSDIRKYFKTGEAPAPQSDLLSFYRENRFSREATNLREANREIEKLRTMAEYWKGQTQRTTRENAGPNERDVKTVAEALIADYGSSEDPQSIRADIRELARYIMRGEPKTHDVRFETVSDMAYHIAQKVVEPTMEVEPFEGMGEQIRKDLRDANIDMTTVIGDFAEGWREIMQITRGKIKNKKGGAGIDTFWMEMQERYGTGVFPEDITNPADQLRYMAELYDQTQTQEIRKPESAYYEEVMWCRNDIIDKVLGEEIRQAPPTKMDKALEKADASKRAAVSRERERLAAQAEKFAKEKKDYAEKARRIKKEALERQERKLKEHFREVQKNQRERRSKTALWRRILAKKNDFLQLKAKPGQAASRHAPAELANALAAVADCFNIENRKRTVNAKGLTKSLADLSKVYEAMKGDERNGVYYDDGLADFLKQTSTAFGSFEADALDLDELERMDKLLRSFHHTITHANQFMTRQWSIGLIEAGRKWTREVMEAAPVLKGLAGDLLNFQLRPDSFFARLSGFAKNSVGEQVQKMFADSTERMLTVQRAFYQNFREYSEDKRFDKLTARGKKDLVDVGLKDTDGNKVLLTRDMMLAVYKHLGSQDNLEAAAYGGLEIPDLDKYYTGKVAAAFDAHRKTAHADYDLYEIQQQLRDQQELARNAETEADRAAAEEAAEQLEEQIRQVREKSLQTMLDVRANISKMLTDYEKKLIEASESWMDQSAAYINEVTMNMYGFEKANVPKYWPMHRDTNFVQTDMRNAVDEINLENWGSLKERVKSHAPIKLTGFIFELDNHTVKMSRYYGFAEAQRDFNKLYNTQLPSARSSLAEQVQKKFGSNQRKLGVSGQQYIDAYLASISGANEVNTSFFSLIRRNLPRATLTINLRVAVSQLASIPTAAGEIGWGAMLKGMPRGFKTAFSTKAKNELAEKNVWFWQRYRGEGGMREFADMKEEQNWFDRGWNKLAGTKVGKVLFNWCQDFDVFATASMWAMSEEYVKSNTDLKPGTEEFDRRVGEVYRDVIRKTQPNYTETERSDLLRDKREGMKFLTMYKTQSNQNLNIVYEASARFAQYKRDLKNGKNGVTQADVNQAGRQLARAYTSVLLGGTLAFSILRAAANAILHNMNAYRDDDDEVTLDGILNGILDETIGAFAGMFAFGSEIESAVMAIVKKEKYWGLTDSAVSALSDLVEQSVDAIQKATDADKDLSRDDVEKLVKTWAQILGIPYDNGKKIYEGVWGHIEDIQNGEFLSFESGVKRTGKTEAKKLVDAMLDGDKEKAEKAWEHLLETKADKKDPEGTAQNAVKDHLKDLYFDDGISEKQMKKLLKTLGWDDDDKIDEFVTGAKCKKETGYAPGDLKEGYLDGAFGDKKAIQYLKEYKGKDADEAEETLNYWKMNKKYGFDYNDTVDMYAKGKISEKEAKTILMTYGDYSEEDADDKVLKWGVNKEYGFDYDDTREQYVKGNISGEEAAEIWSKYGGMEDEKIADRLLTADFLAEHPEVDEDNVTANRVELYDLIGKGANIPADKFMEYAKKVKTFHGEVDAKGKSIPYSTQDKIIAWIDTLDLSPAQKTAVFATYFDEGKIPTNSYKRIKW